MKKPIKPEAAKAAKSATPARPAPSPAKKEKLSKKSGASAALATLTLEAEAAPSIKQFASAGVVTTIGAQMDVGFGNTLYIRGEGPGLSWEKGVPLDCIADDHWSISLSETTRPVVFKFLINDITWCRGDDFVAQPGATLITTPAF